MLKQSLFFLLFLGNFYSNAQLKKAEEFYPNGIQKYNGKYISCVVDYIDGVYLYEKRKSGQWLYYHSSGSIKRIEQYTKSKSCKKDIYKDGKWQYFNEEGLLYLEERYEKDTLISKEIEIYTGDALVGKISLNGEKYDSIHFGLPSSSDNLIPNPGFETYYYKPIRIVNDGQNQIEDMIPEWYSPDKATPDYYNRYRSIIGVPDNLPKGLNTGDGHGYIGLITYFHPKNKIDDWHTTSNVEYGDGYVYSETIQTKLLQRLEKGQMYCFNAQILLSLNAGLSVDRFGAYLSENSIRFKYDEFPQSPQISFHFPLSKTQDWTTICDLFVAQGDEQFITLGRFSKIAETDVAQESSTKSSQLDINNSAYYLLDNIALYEVSSEEECKCIINGDSDNKKINIDSEKLYEYFEIRDKKKGSLKNVHFDFDKAKIKKSSLPELQKLKDFLFLNPEIKILITGHTDHSGAEIYNKELSLQRAEAIENWLIQEGVEPTRIHSKGLGFDSPVYDNKTEYNKSENRRVEFEIVNE